MPSPLQSAPANPNLTTSKGTRQIALRSYGTSDDESPDRLIQEERTGRVPAASAPMRLNHLRRITVCLLLTLLSTGAASAADFGFSVIIQAGLSGGGGPNSWELGIGPSGGSPAVTVNLNPYYGNNTQQRFEIEYTQATNTAFVRIQQTNGVYAEASYNPVGGAPLAPGGTWTLPSSSFFVSSVAVNKQAVGTTVSGLALTPGLNILQGLSTTSLTAAPPANAPNGSTTVAAMSSPVSFQAQATGGNWLLGGTISFAGLSQYYNPGANRQDLRFGFQADAADVPEPSTALSLSLGLAFIGLYKLRRKAQ
jgi:hypothetical protein